MLYTWVSTQDGIVLYQSEYTGRDCVIPEWVHRKYNKQNISIVICDCYIDTDITEQ
jgi:hypothetical protein